MGGVRLILKDHQWERMEPHLPGKRSDLPGADPFTGQPQRISYLPHRQLSLCRHPALLVVDHEKADARVTDPTDKA
jgi:hypothetical protein